VRITGGESFGSLQLTQSISLTFPISGLVFQWAHHERGGR
jgi:hypothetical protein